MDIYQLHRPPWLRAVISNEKYYLIYDAKSQNVTVQRIPHGGAVIGFVWAENRAQAIERINQATIDRYRKGVVNE